MTFELSSHWWQVIPFDKKLTFIYSIRSLKSISAFGSKAGTKPIDPHLLQPVLDKSAGYYQIGPVEAGSDRFVFSVAVALAANLVQVLYHFYHLSA